MKDIQNIIWDWNGTLLDDVDICIETLNILLEKREMKSIHQDTYKSHFTFPVKMFYEKIGFDFSNDNFELISEEYIEKYLEFFKKATLFQNTVDTLKYFKKKGLFQYVLSAMEQPDLLNSIYQKGIKHYFKAVYGSADKFANGKTEVARRLIAREKMIPEDTLFIGDTLHDWEVAKENGCHIILISNGHQSRQRLLDVNVPVVNTINEVINFFQ
jgi:phosphoglycolate phosphatase